MGLSWEHCEGGRRLWEQRAELGEERSSAPPSPWQLILSPVGGTHHCIVTREKVVFRGPAQQHQVCGMRGGALEKRGVGFLSSASLRARAAFVLAGCIVASELPDLSNMI